MESGWNAARATSWPDSLSTPATKASAAALPSGPSGWSTEPQLAHQPGSEIAGHVSLAAGPVPHREGIWLRLEDLRRGRAHDQQSLVVAGLRHREERLGSDRSEDRQNALIFELLGQPYGPVGVGSVVPVLDDDLRIDPGFGTEPLNREIDALPEELSDAREPARERENGAKRDAG